MTIGKIAIVVVILAIPRGPNRQRAFLPAGRSPPPRKLSAGTRFAPAPCSRALLLGRRTLFAARSGRANSLEHYFRTILHAHDDVEIGAERFHVAPKGGK
jgi:hypothetical protein